MYRRRFFRVTSDYPALSLRRGDAIRFDPNGLYPITVLRHLGAGGDALGLALEAGHLVEVAAGSPAPWNPPLLRCRPGLH